MRVLFLLVIVVLSACSKQTNLETCKRIAQKEVTLRGLSEPATTVLMEVDQRVADCRSGEMTKEQQACIMSATTAAEYASCI